MASERGRGKQESGSSGIFLNGIKLEFTCYNIDAEVEVIYIRLTLQPID